MCERRRADRFAVVMDPKVLKHFTTERAAWYESESEIKRGVEWGREKARLLRWVRKQMSERLSATERKCVELYYFQGRTYREAAAITGTNPSSVYRAVRRSVRKLRAAAEEDQIAPKRGNRVRRLARRAREHTVRTD